MTIQMSYNKCQNFINVKAKVSYGFRLIFLLDLIEAWEHLQPMRFRR